MFSNLIKGGLVLTLTLLMLTGCGPKEPGQNEAEAITQETVAQLQAMWSKFDTYFEIVNPQAYDVYHQGEHTVLVHGFELLVKRDVNDAAIEDMDSGIYSGPLWRFILSYEIAKKQAEGEYTAAQAQQYAAAAIFPEGTLKKGDRLPSGEIHTRLISSKDGWRVVQ
jgi:hypothetical protein